jgi:hypothetical protein
MDGSLIKKVERLHPSKEKWRYISLQQIKQNMCAPSLAQIDKEKKSSKQHVTRINNTMVNQPRFLNISQAPA